MAITKSRIAQELERIATAHDGMLRAEDVVEAARRKTSPLHDSFEWDNTVAAEQFRLVQAQRIIRVHVVVVGDGKEKHSQRVFVSLTTDRHPEGGYRRTVDVLADDELYRQLLTDARTEMKIFVAKYARVQALQNVINEMRAVLAAEEVTAA